MTREDPGAPPNLDEATAADAPKDRRRGVIYTIAPSPIPAHAGTIWIGTDDGYIQVTTDGGASWRNVTPPELTPWSKLVMIQASHFDPSEAFAAVDRHRLEDNEPYLYRTRDAGKTWQGITRGLPPGVYMQTVKEDPQRKGLLFAGTELAVFVSFNDGDDWQSLQLNLPAVSMRDLAVRGDDLIVATHGRGFWVLDDITSLRQLTEKSAGSRATLFRPAPAIRMHAGNDDGTPLPRDEAFAENPPVGAMIDYYLASAAAGPVTLEVLDAKGATVRRYSSDDHAPAIDPNKLDIPAFWRSAPPTLSAAAGSHRWIWDLQYTPVPSPGRGGFGGGGGVTAVPGAYAVKLTVEGQTYTQPLTVKMDPRINAPLADLQKQFEVATAVAQDQLEINDARRGVAQLHDQILALRKQASANAALVSALDALDSQAQAIGGASPTPDVPGSFTFTFRESASLTYLASTFGSIAGAVKNGDAAPTAEALKALADARQALAAAKSKWAALLAKDLPAVNAQLKQAGLAPIAIGAAGPAVPSSRPEED